LISYEKKNPTTTFIQLLRTKTIKNKIRNKYSEKNMKKKKKKSYLNVVATEAKKRKTKQIRKVY
jgi:hypothetical protein